MWQDSQLRIALSLGPRSLVLIHQKGHLHRSDPGLLPSFNSSEPWRKLVVLMTCCNRLLLLGPSRSVLPQAPSRMASLVDVLVDKENMMALQRLSAE